MEQIGIVILAGGSIPEDMAGLTQVVNKALIKLNNKEVITFIVDALKNSQYINLSNSVLVGDENIFSFLKPLKVIPSKDNILENVLEGINYLNTLSRILIITADVPLVTGAMIDEFIRECQKSTAHFYYPIIPESEILKKFPDAKRTYAKIKEGKFTGGNFVLVDPIIFKSNADLFKEVINNRKSPFKLVKQLGILFLIKLIMGRLSIPDVENRIKKILNGLIFKAILFNYAEVGMDIDKKEDLVSIENYLGKN